jgi:hypothetical protein
MLTASDRLGLLLGVPGAVLASAIVVYLLFATTVCDPLYQQNALLDFEFLAKVSPGVAAKLGGPISPLSREGLAFYRAPSLPAFCSSPR